MTKFLPALSFRLNLKMLCESQGLARKNFLRRSLIVNKCISFHVIRADEATQFINYLLLQSLENHCSNRIHVSLSPGMHKYMLSQRV